MPSSSKKKQQEAEEAEEDEDSPKKRTRRESAPLSEKKGKGDKKLDKTPKKASRKGEGKKKEEGGGDDDDVEDSENHGEGKKNKKESKKAKLASQAPSSMTTESGESSNAGEGKKSKKERKKERLASQTASPMMGGIVEPSGVETKVHMARFVEYQPSGITAIAHDNVGKRLAVARANGDIQIWSTALPRWHPVAVCSGSSLSQIRTLCWSRYEAETVPGGARLFSASLDGKVTEWSLGSLMPVHVCDTYGGSAWCMAASPDGRMLAVGCHDGMCRLFSVSADYGPVFHKSLPPHPGQVLSVGWHPEGTSIVTGDGASRVRVYSLATMSCTHTIGVGVDLGDGGKSSMVWCVTILEDLTIFAGDSKGRTYVIDGRSGVVLRDFSAHHGGDILSLAADEHEVFSAGVDGRVVHYRRVKDAQSGFFSWVITGAARFHTHDVRAVCVCGLFCPPNAPNKPGQLPPADPTHPQGRAFQRAPLNKTNLQRCIVAGGIDTQLSIYTYDRTGEGRSGSGAQGITPVHRLPPWPHISCVRFSNPVKFKDMQGAPATEVRMLSWQHDQADLWRWPVKEGKELKEPKYAVKIHTWANENVRCAGISPCGGWVIVSHSTKLVAFKITVDDTDGTLDVSKEALPEGLSKCAANEICFTPNGERVVLAGVSGRLLLVNLNNMKVECSFQPSDYVINDLGLLLQGGDDGAATLVESSRGEKGQGSSLAVTLLDVSSDGQWLASCDLGAVVHIFNLQGDVYHATLPTLPARMTCLRFFKRVSMQQELVCVTAENRFYIFDVEACRLTDWSRQFSSAIPSNLINFPLHCMWITFDLSRPSTLLLHGSSFLCNIDLDKISSRALSATTPLDSNSDSKKRKWTKKAPEKEDLGFKLIHKYGPVLSAEYLSEGNLVIVERQWLQVLEQLGGTFYRKRYGK